MQAISQIIYRYLTKADFYNISERTDSGTSAGSQSEIHFPTNSVSVSKWRGFLSGVNGVSETKGENGPRWEVPTLSIHLKNARQTPVELVIYQRRRQTVCIANQHISGNRLPAWHPDTGFPAPLDPSKRHEVPAGLAVYLARTATGQVWAGWFHASTLDGVCRSEEAVAQLGRMLEQDNEPGSTGFIACEPGTLFLNDSVSAAPAFLSREEAQTGQASRLAVKTLKVTGFRSFRSVCCDFGALNVLIGANGAGKSNLLSLINLMVHALDGRLDEFVQNRGGAKALLHLGPGTTKQISIQAVLQTGAAENILLQTFGFKPPDSLYCVQTHGDSHSWVENENVLVVDSLWSVVQPRHESVSAHLVVERFRTRVAMLHLLDTSLTAPVRQDCYINDNGMLRPDGGNLAAVLYLFRQTKPRVYQRICSAVRKVVPGFDDFVLEPRQLAPDSILLNWRQKGSDYVFGPHQISDGSLRAMTLIAMLLQPESSLPDLIILDEPELGLHPHAASMIAGLIRAAAVKSQVVVCTQSPTFVDEFLPEEVIIVEAPDRESRLRRLNPESLKSWLEEYSLGELWQKNVLGGGPV